MSQLLNYNIQEVEDSFFNIVDLINSPIAGVTPELFPTEEALIEYTIASDKIFPRDDVEAGGLLVYVLRRIMNPRPPPFTRGFAARRRGAFASRGFTTSSQRGVGRARGLGASRGMQTNGFGGALLETGFGRGHSRGIASGLGTSRCMQMAGAERERALCEGV